MAMNNPADNMSRPENQKAKRCKINDLIQEKLNGDVLKNFEAFLEFLKQEKINIPWARFGWEGIHTFHIKHKGKGIGELSFLDDENHVRIQINNDWNNLDLYVKGQPNEITDVLTERLSYKCICCRPDWGCGKDLGKSVKFASKNYVNICASAPFYVFISDNMNTFTLYTPLWQQPRKQVGVFPLETVNKLILAKREHIVKTIAK